MRADPGLVPVRPCQGRVRRPVAGAGEGESPERSGGMIEAAFIGLLYFVWGAVLFGIVTGLVLFAAWLFGIDLDRVRLP